MAQLQKANYKDILLVVIGSVIFLALLALPIWSVISFKTAYINEESEASSWLWFIMLTVLAETATAIVFGILALRLGLGIRLLLGLKWFLLAFDAVGLAFILGVFLSIPLGLFWLVPIPFSIAAGIFLLLLLAKTKSRLLAQNPAAD